VSTPSNVVSLNTSPARIIAIVHRVKKTVDNEARPTLVAISLPGEDGFNCLTLDTEREEFDFITSSGKFTETGLQKGDLVITTLGGSGDRMSYAMSRALVGLDGSLYRIPGFHLKDFRDTPEFLELNEDAREDMHLLHILYQTKKENFFECRIRDREIIRISELYRQFKDAQLERMKCAGRLRARLVGSLYLSDEGGYPEGKIEDWFDEQKANDPIFCALESEEKKAKSELERALNLTRIAELFDNVTGCGPSIIGGLIMSIGDIRRFAGPEKLTSYLGLAVLKDDFTKAKKGETIVNGVFPRQRRGMRTSWNRYGRQTLYLLSDQFNRRPESEWGKRFIANKKYYRDKHTFPVLIETVKEGGAGRTFALQPGTFEKKGAKYLVLNDVGDMIEVRGKLRYYDGHIHRMAVWKTLREFVHWLYGAWTEFEQAEYVPKEAKQKRRLKKAA